MSQGAINLVGKSRGELERLFVGMGEKPFRARQVMRWLYSHAELDPHAMTDLSVAFRERLSESARFALPTVMERQEASDGVWKWQLAAGGNQAIETVFIPEASRGTLCISSQVGCALDCSFCATGRQGFNRNLDAAEIIGQVVLAGRELAEAGEGKTVTNVVFMGMGEPLANFRPVAEAVDVLTDDLGFGLSRRRVTVSTSGLVPQIRRLAESARVALAVSLHAPDDEVRNELVPINRRHPIAELLPACWDYVERTNTRDVTFEYVMLAGVNDSLVQARQLARLLRNRPAKVNLIPFNPFPDSGYERSTSAQVDDFRDVLMSAGIMTITRKTRGDDIAAACGQLAGRVNNLVSAPLGGKSVGNKSRGVSPS
jgi:23S rRNA (adenine2503-C2)-methyltransferase